MQHSYLFLFVLVKLLDSYIMLNRKTQGDLIGLFSKHFAYLNYFSNYSNKKSSVFYKLGSLF